MNTPLRLLLTMSAIGIDIASTTNCFAQTKIITLAAGPNAPQTYATPTNQIVQITAFAGYPALPFVSLYHSSGKTVVTTNIGTYTGLTNISVSMGNSGYS